MSRPCDSCGTTKGKIRWYMSWFNGFEQVHKWYCAPCVRQSNTPPIKQVKLRGTARREDNT
ncbi:MAG: hypothetical protein Q8N51_17810 [Gammaproteobacteria bacterium]|nr:hypothetical protein [Gammaproteobacteria bacterium]